MINRPLPPVSVGDRNTWSEQIQAFFMCYLASYSATPVQTRPLQSYQLAWGFDNVKIVPRVGGGMPGYLIAVFTYGTWKHVIVAIEGMSSASQLLTLQGNQTSTRPGWRNGNVWALPYGYAQTLHDALLADPVFTGPALGSTSMVTFAGFSLGAAIADILASRFRSEYAYLPIRLQKFASPRVGNQLWYDAYYPTIERSSLYVVGDPIWLYPYQTLNNSISFIVGNVLTYNQVDPNSVFLSKVDGNFTQPEALSRLDANFIMLQACRALNPDNPWYNHQLWMYRFALQRKFRSIGQSLDYFRVAYLEHNDENNWQVQFPNAQTLADMTPAVLGTPPDVAVVPSSRDQQIEELYQADTSVGGGGGGGDDDLDSGIGGGDYDLPDPTIRRRTPRGVPVPRG